MHHKSPAFTLIELIIGITILSLLAVALLAALDPIEQISKARDTAKRNLAVELHGAYVRYNANKDVYPDKLAAVMASPDKYLDNNGSPPETTDITSDIKQLISAGELKPNFLQAAGSNLNTLRVVAVKDPTSGDPYLSICFKPQSKLELQKQGLFTIANGTNLVTGKWEVVPTVDNKDGACGLAGNKSRTACVYCAQ